MTCSDIRESISARLDGEPEPIGPADLHRHLAGCVACRDFETETLRLRALTQRAAEPAPDLTDLIMRRAPRVHPARARREERVLRFGLVMVATAELLATAALFLLEHGYGGEDHAGHESLSFTIGVCVGLFYVAARPRAAAAYLPLLGVAVSLLTLTAVVDVHAGRAGLLEELPHLNLLVGFGILWSLSRSSRPDGGARARRADPSPRSPAPAARLRLLTRSLTLRGRPLGALMRAGGALSVVVLTVLLGAAPASAHAVLEGSNPAPNSVLSAAPTRVTLSFDEAVTTLPTSLRVYGPGGTRADDGVVQHLAGAGPKVTVGMRKTTERGTYLVSWRVISADSHPVSGAFTFSVGDRTTAPKAPEERTNAAVSISLGASRFLGYAGCALFVGGLAFVVLCWPAGRTSAGVRLLLLAGALTSTIAAAAALLLKGPYDAALGLGTIAHGDLLRETLSTTYGRSVLARMILAATATVVLLVRVPKRPRGVLLALAALALLLTFPAAGHAVAGDQRALALPSDLVHVAAMSIWLGGLATVALVLLRSTPRDAAAAVSRFSKLAAACVLALVITGTYQAWRQVRSWGALTHTTYGRELLVKVALVALVLAAAALSRSWVNRTRVPGEGATADLRRLRRTVGAEVLLTIGVLAVTSALVATEPARTAYHPTVAANLTLGPDTVQVSAVPAGNRTMDIHLYVFDKALQPTDPPEVSAEVFLDHPDIGPLPLDLHKVDTGHEVGQLSVPISGDWTLTVRVRTTAFDEYGKDLSLPIR